MRPIAAWDAEKAEVTVSFPCPECGGEGETADGKPCLHCGGKRRVRESRNLRELLGELGVAFAPEPED